MMKKSFNIILFALLASALLSIFSFGTQHIVLAEKCSTDYEKPLLTISPWYHDLCDDSGKRVEISTLPDDIVVLILNIINIAIQIGGYVAIGFVIWGGIKYILSNGESSKTASAKTTIQNALIGLLITLASVAIVNFIIGLY